MKTTHIVILVALAGFVALLGINLGKNTSTYTDFSAAKASEKEVHIVGEWVNRDQSNYDPTRDLFQFYMKDTVDNVQLVHYYDPKPVNFEAAEKVVIIGEYNQDVFVADKIIMKCPSKFEQTELTAVEPKFGIQ